MLIMSVYKLDPLNSVSAAKVKNEGSKLLFWTKPEFCYWSPMFVLIVDEEGLHWIITTPSVSRYNGHIFRWTTYKCD